MDACEPRTESRDYRVLNKSAVIATYMPERMVHGTK
jgi:hypothetical protein